MKYYKSVQPIKKLLKQFDVDIKMNKVNGNPSEITGYVRNENMKVWVFVKCDIFYSSQNQNQYAFRVEDSPLSIRTHWFEREEEFIEALTHVLTEGNVFY